MAELFVFTKLFQKLKWAFIYRQGVLRATNFTLPPIIDFSKNEKENITLVIINRKQIARFAIKKRANVALDNLLSTRKNKRRFVYTSNSYLLYNSSLGLSKKYIKNPYIYIRIQKQYRKAKCDEIEEYCVRRFVNKAVVEIKKV